MMNRKYWVSLVVLMIALMAATVVSAEAGTNSYWSKEALVKLQADVENHRKGVPLYEYVSISEGNNAVFYVAEKVGEPFYCYEYHGDKGQWNSPVKEDEVAMAGIFWTPSELDWTLIPKVVEDAQMQVFSLGAMENHQGEKVELVSFSKTGVIVTMSNSQLEGKWLQYRTDEKGTLVEAQIEEQEVH